MTEIVHKNSKTVFVVMLNSWITKWRVWREEEFTYWIGDSPYRLTRKTVIDSEKDRHKLPDDAKAMILYKKSDIHESLHAAQSAIADALSFDVSRARSKDGEQKAQRRYDDWIELLKTSPKTAGLETKECDGSET